MEVKQHRTSQLRQETMVVLCPHFVVPNKCSGDGDYIISTLETTTTYMFSTKLVILVTYTSYFKTHYTLFIAYLVCISSVFFLKQINCLGETGTVVAAIPEKSNRRAKVVSFVLHYYMDQYEILISSIFISLIASNTIRLRWSKSTKNWMTNGGHYYLKK